MTVASLAGAQPGVAPAPASLLPVGSVYGPVAVITVRDGDTIVVASDVGPRIVRLIGVDAPEVSAGEAFGVEATIRLEDLIPVGASVWLELDLGPEDIYGRLLAYVYVADSDGRWRIAGRPVRQVNLALMESGWARTMAIPPNVTYADLYKVAEVTAREAGAGIWSVGTPPDPSNRADQSGSLANDNGAAPGATATATTTTPAIALHCALVNPDTPNDTAGEWVSVWLGEHLDTRGYYLHDEGSQRVFRLPAGVQPAGEFRIGNPSQGVWNNGGDVIYLKRGGEVIDSWAYSGAAAVQGRVVCRQPR